MKRIVTDEKKLSMRSDEIDVRKDGQLVQKIVLQLKEVVRAKNLTSLAAIQIGYPKRIFVINFNGDVRTFVNPIITNVKGFELATETCASIPDKKYVRPRYNRINVTYQTPLGKIESREFVGLAAIVFQHNVDHLDGLLLSDIGLEVGEDFYNSSDEEKQEVISAYLDALDIKQKEIQKEVSENPELKQISDAVEFMTGVATGKVQLGEPISLKKDAIAPVE